MGSRERGTPRYDDRRVVWLQDFLCLIARHNKSKTFLALIMSKFTVFWVVLGLVAGSYLWPDDSRIPEPDSQQPVRRETHAIRVPAPITANALTRELTAPGECAPLPEAELQVLSGAGYSPEALESYSVLNRATVTELAHQGDTLAMLALAELEVYSARGFGDEANWTARHQMSSDRPIEVLSKNEQRERWNEALHWYYRAALEGRVLALIQYGRTLSETAVTPAELGWLPEADYHPLTDAEKQAMAPSLIYSEVAKRLAPESYDWAMRPVDSITPEHEFTDAHEFIIASTVERFFKDLDAGGYATPEALTTNFPVYSMSTGAQCLPGSE